MRTICSLLLLFAASLSIAAANDREDFTGEITAASLGSTLTSGTYVVPDNVSLVANATGLSALSVTSGATVVIYIPTNVTLAVTGANGYGATPGGAGIRVPETATLVLTGEGTVIATGGKAGNGGNGLYAEGGSIEHEWGYPGAGGPGGGGAGAGIGGIGGAGAVKTAAYGWGKSGANGENCGTVVVLGALTVTCTGGSGGLLVGFPGGDSEPDHRYLGGAGGGAGRAAPSGLGGGGAGGGAGGGGIENKLGTYGLEGYATAGNADGTGGRCQGTGYTNGGAVGTNGLLTAFTVSTLSHVNVADLATGYADTHVAARHQLSFDNRYGEVVGTMTVTLGAPLPRNQVQDEREGYAFTGWMTRKGELVYDSQGAALFTCAPWPKDATLYVSREPVGDDVEIWENTVEVNDGETLVIDGETICHAADGALFHVKRGGRLCLYNTTIFGSVINHKPGAGPAILGDGQVVCSNCVFESIRTAGDGEAAVYRTDAILGTSARFVNCTFRTCSSAHEILGLTAEWLAFVNCTFTGNYAKDRIIGVSEYSEAAFVNCLLSANAAGVSLASEGGATSLYESALVGNDVGYEAIGLKYCIRGVDAQVGNTFVTNGVVPLSLWQSPDEQDFVGRERRRTVNGVEHSYHAPLVDLRLRGGYVWRSDDWSAYSVGGPSGTATIPLDFDQLGGTATGYIGPIGGDLLQWSVDHPDENGVCAIPAGTYTGACVKPGSEALEICGASGAVIDGEGELFGLYVDRTNVTVRGLEFRNCAASRGGAISSEPAKETLVEACRFEACSASDTGGALYGVATARSCLFVGNTAVTNGGAVAETTCQNCTFVGNAAAGSTSDATAAGHRATLVNCLLYQNILPTTAADGGTDVTAGTATRAVSVWPFVGKAGGSDYHLSFLNLAKLGVEATYLEAAEDWLDLDGSPYVNRMDREVAYYLGCYAATPWKVNGSVVNDTSDGYLDTGLRTTLREAIEYAYQHPTSGVAVVTFADELFSDDGSATIRLASAQVDLADFTDVELTVRGPADGRTLVIDGDGQYRAFRVRPANRLRLENLTFANCFGSAAGQSPQPGFEGGVVLNYGSLVVSNCAFRASSTGWLKGSKIPSSNGEGGAIWNGAAATAMVERCTFAGNVAARGGAIANVGGFLTVAATTFSSNRAESVLATGGVRGGAFYQENSQADALFANCTFVDNLVSGAPGESLYAASGATNAVNVLADVPATNWFARLDATGTSAVPVEATNGVRHLWYPLLEGIDAKGLYVRHDVPWKNAYCGTSSLPALMRTKLRGSSTSPMPILLDADQLGNAFTSMVKGAVILSEPRSVGPLPPAPPGSGDDLVVREASEAALLWALRRAAANPSAYVSNGVVTITFADAAAGATIRLSDPLVLDAFAEIPLVIEGPVELDGIGAFPILKVEDGNQLAVKNVRFSNARSEQDGGAISLGEGCSLDADGCWFFNCSAGESGGAISAYDGSRIVAEGCDFDFCNAAGLGGAVFLAGESASARFAECRFWSCASAVDSPDFRTGNAVFADSTEVALVGCTLHGTVEDLTCGFVAWEAGTIDGTIPGYALARAPGGATDLYWTGEAAAAEALEGDVLFLVATSATVPESLPTGVGIVDDFRWGHAAGEWTTTPVTDATYRFLASEGDVFNLQPVDPTDYTLTKGDGSTTNFATLAELVAYTNDTPWFDYTLTDFDVTRALNDLARPTVAAIWLDDAGENVFITPGALRPELWYGIRFAPTPTNEFERVADGPWRQADGAGALEGPLVVPANGRGEGFYRVEAAEVKP